MNGPAAAAGDPDAVTGATGSLAVARQRLVRAIHADGGGGALVAGLQRGFHRQLLLAWVLMLLLPSLVAALPTAVWLLAQFGHSPRAGAIAHGLDPLLAADALQAPGNDLLLLGGISVFSLLFAAALSPWLSGMIVAQIRTVYRMSMGGVLRAGLGEYPRMLRMLLWSLALMALAAALGLALAWLAGAGRSGDGPPARAWLLLPALLVALVHVTVEAARGWLGADLALRSVVEAWKRGVRLLLRRPGATLTVYLGTSVVGYGLAWVFLQLRRLVDASDWSGWLIAFVLTQLVVAALAWGRSARLHGLADLATAIVIAQQPPSPEQAARDLDNAAARQVESAY